MVLEPSISMTAIVPPARVTRAHSAMPTRLSDQCLSAHEDTTAPKVASLNGSAVAEARTAEMLSMWRDRRERRFT
jgi:hypothetical protein